MNRQFLISGVVMSIVALLIGGVVHGGLLAADYAQLPGLMRPQEEQMQYFPYNIVAHVFIGFAITWIYRQGMDATKPPLGQGVRFGIAVACLMTVPIFLIYYAVQPLPMTLVVKQIAFDGTGTILMGIIVAYLNRPPAAAPA
jgi:hypothetical protein